MIRDERSRISAIETMSSFYINKKSGDIAERGNAGAERELTLTVRHGTSWLQCWQNTPLPHRHKVCTYTKVSMTSATTPGSEGFMAMKKLDRTMMGVSLYGRCDCGRYVDRD